MLGKQRTLFVANIAICQTPKSEAEQSIAEITANMSIPEIPADEDVAEAVVWLCSDRARMITGQSLRVNGGELMR